MISSGCRGCSPVGASTKARGANSPIWPVPRRLKGILATVINARVQTPCTGEPEWVHNVRSDDD